jgi:tetratricopeptide (TPR) repeat protein
MNSNTAETEGRPPSKTQNISRFHPRSSARPDDGLESRSGGDLKTKESWVHTPAGLRTAPNASRSAEFPSATIPKVVVTKSKSTSQGVGASAELPLPVSPEVPPIPAWLLAETAIAFKVGAVVIFLLGALIAFKYGEHRGRKVALREMKPAPATALAAATAFPAAEFPEDLLPALDAALKMLRKGDNPGARDALNKMLASHPQAPSIHYAAAIAALQSGYPREADRLADTSIKNGFRVSDSWALKAAIAASLSKGATPERESLLKKAIKADPMNPAPFIELASLLRYQGRNDLAASLLESAASRLNPADAETVVATTRAILAVEGAENLVPLSQPLGIPAKDLPNAYAEMRRGNFENAAAILRFCRDQTAPDIFSYLVNDPALRKFTSRPELREFY